MKDGTISPVAAHASGSGVEGYRDNPLKFRGHIPALDGIRGLAVLVVIVFHSFLFGEMERSSAIDRAAAALAGIGWSGVDLFFVLSGFLITGILLDARREPRFFSTFYIRRTLRIFPLYYGVLIAFFVVLPRLFPTHPAVQANTQGQVWFWTYLSNIQTAVFGWSGTSPYVDHFWSLAVEEQFYLLWPLVVWFLSLRQLARLCGAIMVGSLLLRIWLCTNEQVVAAFVLMPARMDALAVGAGLATALRIPEYAEVVRRLARRVLGAAVALLAALFVMRGGLHKTDPVVATIGFSLVALAFGGLLLLAIEAAPSTRLFRLVNAPPLRSLGKYSYALYIFHQPVMLLLVGLGISAMTIPPIAGVALTGQLVFGAIAGVLSLAAAVCSWNLFEKHLLKLKDRWSYVAGASAMGAVATGATRLHHEAVPSASPVSTPDLALSELPANMSPPVTEPWRRLPVTP